jgi:hypothetical protein
VKCHAILVNGAVFNSIAGLLVFAEHDEKNAQEWAASFNLSRHGATVVPATLTLDQEEPCSPSTR